MSCFHPRLLLTSAQHTSRARGRNPRRGRGTRPPRAVPDAGVRVADVVERVVVVPGDDLGNARAFEDGHRLEDVAFGAVVGHEDDEGVVQLVGLAQIREDAT